MHLDAGAIAETLKAEADEIRNQEIRKLLGGDIRDRKEILLFDPLTNISLYLGIEREWVNLCTAISVSGREEEIVINQMRFRPTGVILRRNNETVYFFRELPEGIEILEIRSTGHHSLGPTGEDYLDYLRDQSALS